jgi:hypothetical protein
MASRTPKKNPALAPVGLPGLEQYDGYIREEKHVKLRGGMAAGIYEEMAQNDATIGAVLYIIESFLRRVEFRVKASDNTPAAKEQAEFVQQCMEDMDHSWDEFIADALSMLVYGFSLHEVVYKIRGGPDSGKKTDSKYNDRKLGWRAIPSRSQKTIERWDIDEDTGEIHGAYQTLPTDSTEVYIPLKRCVLFRTRATKNNPEGVSMLRRAYRSWAMKKRLEEYEAIGIARDLNGLPVMEVPPEIMAPGASQAQKAVRSQVQKMVSLIARDRLEALVIPAEIGADGQPTGYKFRLVSSSGVKQILADSVIRRYDSRIAMTLACDFLMLGTEKTGSFALAAEKSTHFVRSLDWYARTITDQVNRVLIRGLMQVNGVPQELWPTMTFDAIATPGLQELGTYIQQIAAAGMLTPTPELEKHLRTSASIPEPTEEEADSIKGRHDSPPEPPPAAPPDSPPEAPPAVTPEPEVDSEEA